MKIAQIADILDESGGGIPPVVAGLCGSLTDHGVETICLARGGKQIADFKKLTTRVLPSKGPKVFGWIPGVSDLLKDWQPDIIHVHGIWTGHFQAAARFAQKNDLPLVVSPHGMLESWALDQSKFKKLLLRRLFVDQQLREASCFQALNGKEKNSIQSLYPEVKCAVIPNGMVLPKLSKTVAQGKKALLFLGRIHPKKGILPLLEAWASIDVAKRQHWQLILAGWDDGGHEKEVRSKIQELNLSEHVSLPGKVFGAEKAKLYRRADAFVLPSFSEGLPMTILEAWSYQLPVLMTDECHLREGFDAEAAIKIDPNPESISKGLIKLFSLSQADQIRIGENGRKLVEERFTWDFVASQMNQVYCWLAGKRQEPTCVKGR